VPHTAMTSANHPLFVMAGRDPAIYAPSGLVDTQIKSGHDDFLEER